MAITVLYWLKIMVWALTPEHIVAVAVAAVDLRTTFVSTSRMRKLGSEKRTLKRSFFTMMGRYITESEGRRTALDFICF